MIFAIVGATLFTFYLGGACAIYSVADIENADDSPHSEVERVVACALWPLEALARMMDPGA